MKLCREQSSGVTLGIILGWTFSAQVGEIRTGAHGLSNSRTQDTRLFRGPPGRPLTLLALRDALICRNQEEARGEKELWIRTQTPAAQTLPQPRLEAGLRCPYARGRGGVMGRQRDMRSTE